MNAIPKPTAIELCQQIRLEQITRWYSWFFSPCWNCELFANGNPEKMRIGDQPAHTGCERVNARYQKYLAQRHPIAPKPLFS